jgi:hypothetical protein
MSCCNDQFDILYNFISPVTGRILADFNYVLVGNKQGIAIPSPILIDVRLDLIALRKRYNSLVKGDIVIGHPNNELPNAQVLLELGNGYLYTTDGILSVNTIIPIEDLPDLQYQNIWIGDVTNRPVARQRVGLENLPSFLLLDSFNPLNLRKNLGINNLYTGTSVNFLSPLDTANPTTTMRVDMSNLPNLKVGRMWIGVKNITPPLYVDLTSPYIHITGDLNWDPYAIGSDAYGVPNEVGLDPGYLFIGDMTPGNAGQITTTNVLPSTTLPNLTYKAIWRGDATNRPVEVFDLSVLETRMGNAESAIFALQGAVGQLEVQIGALQLQVGALDTALGLLTLEVQAIAATVGGLVVSVATLGGTVAALGLAVTTLQAQVTQLFNRTLDQIPAAVAIVNLNNNRIANLSDPINPLDAVNLQYLDTAIAASTIASVVGTADEITANTVAGVVTLSLPADVIIATSLNVGTMELFNNTLFTTNTNADLLLSPNGTGRVDVTNHRIINLSDPINPLDAVNLQTMQAAIGGGSITSVLGTTNQITANTSLGVVTLSLPTSVVITTAVTAGNLSLTGNTLQSNNANGAINVVPNGSGNILLTPGSGLVGISGTPSYLLDVFGTTRVSRLLGRTVVTSTIGANNIVGSGRTFSVVGSELSGGFTLTTGTGITTAGIIVTIIFASAMPSNNYSVMLMPSNATTAALTGMYIISNNVNNFTIRNTVNLANSTTYDWRFIVIAN